MSERCTFTVFTPTYNRVQTLPGVFACLQAQTFQDFEWLIVDDGSTDGTGALVQRWQKVAEFPIRYFWQENGGKHRAFNRGVREALGELFLTLDSDDKCLPRALERLWSHWQGIPEGQRHSFSAVTALCVDSRGVVIGDRFPSDILDADSLSCRDIYKVTGDKWGFQRTDILRTFPYPEIPGERYIAESVVWNRLARRYRTRYVNEVLKTVEYLDDGLSASTVRLRVENPVGARLYYAEYLQYATTRTAKVKAAINYVRFSLHGRRRIGEMIADAGTSIWVALGLGGGMLCFFHDRYLLRSRL
jgi:glycosyltransferase involved in cell wall biosynthesis